MDMDITHHLINIPIQEAGSREALKELGNKSVYDSRKPKPNRIEKK